MDQDKREFRRQLENSTSLRQSVNLQIRAKPNAGSTYLALQLQELAFLDHLGQHGAPLRSLGCQSVDLLGLGFGRWLGGAEDARLERAGVLGLG